MALDGSVDKLSVTKEKLATRSRNGMVVAGLAQALLFRTGAFDVHFR